MNNIIEKVEQVLNLSKLIAKKTKRSVFREIVRLIFYKILTGYGSELYLLYGLYEKDKKDWHEFIGKSQMSKMLHRVNKASEFAVLDDKIDFFLFCRHNGLPSPEVAFVINPGEKKYEGIENVDTLEKFSLHMEELGFGNYIFKPVKGSYGDGIHSVKYGRKGFTNLKNGAVLSCSELYREFEKTIPYLVQFTQIPSDQMLKIMPPPACGAIRVISYQREDGEVDFPYSFITVPVKGQVISNFIHGASGNLIVGVNSNTGQIETGYGFGNKGLIRPFEMHPDTNIKFNDLKIHEWNHILKIAEKGAKLFHAIRFIGWDFIVTNKGIFILEANPMCDPDGLQLTRQKGLKNELEELFQS